MNEIPELQDEWRRRGLRAQASAAQALHRLLELAERGDSGQAYVVARFVAATFDGPCHPWDPFDLRAVDVAIADDMMVCLEALRWGLADLHKLIPNGITRIQGVIEAWRIEPT